LSAIQSAKRRYRSFLYVGRDIRKVLHLRLQNLSSPVNSLERVCFHLRLQNFISPIITKSGGRLRSAPAKGGFNSCSYACKVYHGARRRRLQGHFLARRSTDRPLNGASNHPPPVETNQVHFPTLRGVRIQLFLRLEPFLFIVSPRSPPLPLPLLPPLPPPPLLLHHLLAHSPKFLSSKGEFRAYLIAFKTSLVENKHKCSPSTNPLRHSEQARMKSMGDCKSTNLGRDRLRSVDRNNKTTLLLTRRCGTNKSYAKDLSPRMVKLQDVS
jgi:hypothetical protein